MTIRQLLAGTLAIGLFAPAVLKGQDGSASTFSAPPVMVRDAAGLTNAPTAATATVVPEPAFPQVSAPKPAEVYIPLATAPQSGTVAPPSHPQPVMPPTAQGLLSKTMQSGPAGPQNRLAAIATPPPLALATNKLAGDTPSASTTNSPADQSNIWQKSSPSLNGVDYHW